MRKPAIACALANIRNASGSAARRRAGRRPRRARGSRRTPRRATPTLARPRARTARARPRARRPRPWGRWGSRARRLASPAPPAPPARRAPRPGPGGRRRAARGRAAGASPATRRAARPHPTAARMRPAAARQRRGRPRPGQAAGRGAHRQLAHLAGRRVGVGVHAPPQREGGGVDRLGMRRLLPAVRPRWSSGTKTTSRAGCLVAALAQLAATPRWPAAPGTAGSGRRGASLRGQRRPRDLDDQEPEPERERGDDGGDHEDPREHALALVDPAGPPHDLPEIASSRTRSASVAISEAIIPAKATTMPKLTEPVWQLALQADPQPRDRLWKVVRRAAGHRPARGRAGADLRGHRDRRRRSRSALVPDHRGSRADAGPE